MTDRSMDARIHDLLTQAKGDRSRASKALARAAAKDPDLLRSLVGPYLDGIAAHAVGRVAEGRAAAGGPGRKGAPARQKALTSEAMDAVVGRLGKRIGLSRAPEGLSALVDQPSPTRAGSRHEKTVRALAAVYARQRLDRA
ncbi:MAG: hypothetical protein RID91_05530 [Azospirillaceae bacterium]